MKTLYQAANAVEAHMILDLLRQEGITGHVLGEHLQGAVGELPAAGLVRVMVDEADHARGRQIIDTWEATLVHEGIATPSGAGAHGSRGRSWWMLFIGLAIGVAGTYGVYRVPARQQALDHNSDGVPDEVWTYAINGTDIDYEADRNLDGKPDLRVHYARGGLMTESRSDEDFDGVIETRTSYVDNQPEVSETDTDKDGYPDLVTVFAHGVPSEVRYISPMTGKPLRVEHLRLGKLMFAEIDADEDGELDTRWQYGPLGEVRAKERVPSRQDL